MEQSNDRPPVPTSSRTFPSSLPPQLVISWLPVSDVASALCASSAWHRASAPVFQIIAQSRGLGRERADVPWREVVRCSKRRVTVIDPGKRYPAATHYATALGVLDQGWAPGAWGSGVIEVGDAGDFIAEVELERGTGFRIMAFRADRDGKIHIIGRIGVLIGYPGELGTVELTVEDAETLGASDLKTELVARGLRTTGRESQDRTNLTEYLHRYLPCLAYDASREDKVAEEMERAGL